MNDTTWTASEQALWQRIESHPIGGAQSTSFVARLRRENAWSEADADDALREYRRFVFLACAAGHEATPSPRVDAVWHLHLLYTHDYWLDFCPQVLGMPLHHSPGNGAQQSPQHRAQYAQTLASYRRFFGPAPASCWPQPQSDRKVGPGAGATQTARTAAKAGHHRREVSKRALGFRALAIAAGAALPALVWAASLPLGPLDWNGSDFLALYLGLMFAVVVASLVWRALLKRQAETVNRHVGALDVLEIAYLAGGPARAFDAGVAELHRRGVLAWDAGRQRLYRTGPRVELEPMLGAIAQAAGGDPKLDRAVGSADRTLDPIRHQLERRGLWLTREAARRVAALAALPAAALCVFGMLKIAIGIARDKPVIILVFLTLVMAAIALAFCFKRPGRTRAGDRELVKLSVEHRASTTRARPDQVALAVALGGTAVLVGTALAAYHEVRVPPSSSSSSDSSSSSSDSSSDSGGGSSCGGCGGGGGD